MPLGAPPPLAFALSLPGAAAGCWACTRRVMSAAKAATNTGAVRSFMTDDCTRNGGRLLRSGSARADSDIHRQSFAHHWYRRCSTQRFMPSGVRRIISLLVVDPWDRAIDR